MNKDTVYIALKDKIAIDTDVVLSIKDVGNVFCNNKSIQNVVENMEVYKSGNNEDWDYLDSGYIISKAVGYNPSLDINMIGATEVLLEIKSKEKENKVLLFLKVASVLIILFFGSAIAIINFHEDVNMAKSLEKIYFTLTGTKSKKPLIMTIPYSIGMGFGIIGFFNRVISPSERRKKEPGPMEIESYLYDKDMEDYLLNDMKNSRKDRYRENKEI